jgi:hypothetical protein
MVLQIGVGRGANNYSPKNISLLRNVIYYVRGKFVHMLMHHAMKTYGGRRTSILIKVNSCVPVPVALPLGRGSSLYILDRNLSGPGADLGMARKKYPFPTQVIC